MKRSSKVLGIVVVVLALLVTASVASAGLPGTGWWTAEQIQAIESGQTTVTFEAYPQAGTSILCGSTTIDQGKGFVFVPTAAWGINPNCGALPDGFQGSAVVSADKQVFAIVEATNQLAAPLGVSGGTADASYRGTSQMEAAIALSFPAYKNNHSGETSTFYIQNAGTAATHLRATFKECAPPTPGCSGSGADYVYNMTAALEPNRMAVIVPSDAGAPAGQGHFGSLTVQSLDGADLVLAGVVNEASTTSSGAARYLKSTRAFTPAEYDKELYAPVIKKTYPIGQGAATKWSALTIQNVGGGPGNFTITYRIAASPTPARIGTEIVDNTTCQNIAVGQTCFVMTLFPVGGSGTSQLQDGEYASAKVVGTEDMVAVVNEETIYTHTPASDKQFATYSAIPKKATALNVSVPSYKEEWAKRYMGVVVQNVGTAPTTVTATVKNVNPGPSGPPTADLVVQKVNLQVNAAVTFWLLSQNQAQLYGGVSEVSGDRNQFKGTNDSMTVSAGQPLAVIVNQEDSYVNPPAVKLDAASYEGFALP
jgi:hypothetical protein